MKLINQITWSAQGHNEKVNVLGFNGSGFTEIWTVLRARQTKER